MTEPAARATAVVVAYGVADLDLSWLPAGTPIVVVRNDDLLDPSAVPGATMITPGRNVGFGAAVDLALEAVDTLRVVLVNPDILATPAHWQALAQGGPDEVGAVPVVDGSATPTVVVSRYPGPLATLAGGWRLGRFFGRSSVIRRTVLRIAGSTGRDQLNELSGRSPGRLPLATHWASFALVSLPTAAVRAVGGFGGRYFLYFEDVDLCRRLSHVLPTGTIVLHDVPPAVHDVGGAGGRGGPAERHRYQSALVWARQSGPRWAAARSVLRLRAVLEPGLRG